MRRQKRDKIDRFIRNNAKVPEKSVVPILWENVKYDLSHRIKIFQQILFFHVRRNTSDEQPPAIRLLVSASFSSADIYNCTYSSQ